jgi:hypothetical protein
MVNCIELRKQGIWSLEITVSPTHKLFNTLSRAQFKHLASGLKHLTVDEFYTVPDGLRLRFMAWETSSEKDVGLDAAIILGRIEQ